MADGWWVQPALLTRLRDAPQAIELPLHFAALALVGAPRPHALARLGAHPITLRLDAALDPTPARRILAHVGDPRGDGWALAFRGDRAVLHAFAGSRAQAWWSARLRRGWHRLDVAFGADGFPVALHVDARPARPTAAARPEDLHGELPIAATLTLGGVRDRAGGHTNLRYGERPGELIAACGAVGSPAAPAADAPIDPAASQPPDPAAPPADAAASQPPDPSAVRVALRRDAEGWVARATAPPAGGEVWWDLGDRVAVGEQVAFPDAFARRPLGVHLRGPGGVTRLRRPRSGGVTPTPVFRPGEGGYAAYRIPAIVRAADGALLAFGEGRRESVSDSCRTKHLVVRRSGDDGRSWGPLVVAAALPEGPGVRSLMNPSPVVDTVRGTGRIVLVHSALDADEWAIAAGSGRARLRAVASDDHGATWGEAIAVSERWGLPEGIHRAVPDAQDWRIQVGTLGHAIQLARGPHAGRLVCAGHGTFGPGSVFDAIGYLFCSDDLGRTWTLGPAFTARADGGDPRGPNEATLAELPDGTLIVNARHYRAGRPAGFRAVTRVAWDERGRAVPGPIGTDRALVDSGVQASLLALPDPTCPQGRLLFCHPAHPTARLALTLRESRDGGRTWPHARLLVAGRSAYGDLVALPGGVGVLFEDGADGALSFLNVPLEEVAHAAP